MANSPVPMPGGVATPQDLAVAMRYGPQTEQALRRSSYLSDALRQLNTEGAQNIHSGGELAAKLLASAILSRGVNKGQDAVMAALRADQGDETARVMAGLGDAGSAPSGVAAPTPSPPPQLSPPSPDIPPPPAPPVGDVPMEAPSPAAQGSPQDRDALTHMLAVEASGEGPVGMAAAGHVAMNRLKAGYGGAKTLSDVIYAPHQFEGITRGHTPSPAELASAGQVADGILSGQVPDPTGGAMAFLNPVLQQRLGRPIPAWAQGGDGRRIGNHVFFGGGQQVAQNSAAPSGPDAIDQGPSGAASPPPAFDAGAVGAGANPSPSSAPVQSPAVGAAPAGVSPQAPPAGALPPNWPKWRPSQDKIAYVTGLLNDPRHHAEGVAIADMYRQKMLEPEEAQITMVNGIPSYMAKDPTSGVPIMIVPIPQAAMTHIASAEQLGVPAAHGTTFSVDPLGNPKQLTAPPPGQAVTSGPGQPYAEHYVSGSVNDPTRPQAPAPGFRYAQGPAGPQMAIPGSGQDPQSPMNVVAGTQKIQENLKPTIDLARDARQTRDMVTTGYGLQNGPGDIAMLKGLNHLTNRGIVRPDDMEQQLKAGGIAGGLGEVAQWINSKGVLTPEERQKVMAASQAIFRSADQQFKAQVLGHRQTVDAVYGQGAFDKYVVPPDQVQSLGWAALPLGSGQPPPPPIAQPQFAPGSRDAAIAEARRRGLVH